METGGTGRALPDPCGHAALESLPLPQKCILPLTFPAKLCHKDAPAPGSPRQLTGMTGGMQDPTPITPPTLHHFLAPLQPHCHRAGSIMGAAPSPRLCSSKDASEVQTADADGMLMLTLARGFLGSCLPALPFTTILPAAA